MRRVRQQKQQQQVQQPRNHKKERKQPMFKKWLIEKGIKFVIALAALGVGIWYLSYSIGGASLSYTSVDNFMKQISSHGGVAGKNGCFLCYYIQELFDIMGNATETLWVGLVQHLWILMALGFGIFMVVHTIKYLHEQAASKDVKDLTNAEPKLDFNKWFEKVWKTGVRVMIAGALIGAINWSGTSVLKITTNLIVTPVMYVGSLLSMAATGVISGAECTIDVATANSNILSTVLQPFICMMDNLNTVMLAGAGGGFALMNYSWLGLGGGVFTWLAGLGLVILFLIIGFDLVFQVLNVVFKLVFVVIFMPLLIAAVAFEQVWGLAKTAMGNAIEILVNAAVSVLKISLKITLVYAVVYFSADAFYPNPSDGFTSIMPPLLGKITPSNSDAQTMSVMQAFTKCEQVSLVDGELDKDTFKQCFMAQKRDVESQYKNAFDFMENGLDFLLFMIGVFFLYFWVISPEVDKLLNYNKVGEDKFNYGQWVKDTGKAAYNLPGKAFNAIRDKWKQG